MCYIVRVIVAAPDADAGLMPAPTGGVGPSRKLPRKKIPFRFRSLARGHTELCIKVLAGIVSQEAIPPAARVSAAGILLDRGWGRAPQPHAGEDGADILVTIRQIIEGGDDGQGRRQRQRRLWRHLEAGGPDRAGPPPQLRAAKSECIVMTTRWTYLTSCRTTCQRPIDGSAADLEPPGDGGGPHAISFHLLDLAVSMLALRPL